MKTIKNAGIFILITALLWEVSLGVYIRVANLKINLPTYTFENTQGFWFDINEDFGTQHLANHFYRQKKSCFDVDYHSNSKGFRDFNRRLVDSKKRVLAIGDSFIEGYGVDTAYRVTNLLEKEFSLAHLNFGLAGNFSPTQYWILYKNYAAKYSHDAIIVGILPANDFIDDDLDILKKQGSNRYKPFLKGDYPNYKVDYFIKDINNSMASPKRLNFFKKMLSNFSNTYHLYFYLKAEFQSNSIATVKQVKKVPDYFNFNKGQYNRLKYCIEQIVEAADGRKVLLVSIPNQDEIIGFKVHKKNPLGDSLINLTKTKNFEYLDLLLPFSMLNENELNDCFHSCDGHWNEKGNAFAANQIKSNFSYYTE